ncbi:MAG: TonB-dependent receptor [Vicinamibacterales bacterium]
MKRALLVVLGCLALAMPAYAQSTAINGNIEGVVRDSSGGVLPGVTVTVTNVDEGTVRTAVTDAEGRYRAALLPLGTYRVRMELAGFRTVERTGLTLSAGQTATVNGEMSVGGVQEVVEVSADAPVTQPAAIDLGRTITAEEVKNLPNVARNTFNFALLQPNVTGYENEEFGATRMNANGSQMRTNYQIDGASATQKDRAGLRMFQPSEIMVKEVKVTTSGFAPEFGQTTGMVYNAISPSGTNTFSGQGSYRFRRQAFSSRPFNLSPTAKKPDTQVDNVTFAIGGPLVKDKAFFYAGYEYLKNDLSADRVITVTPATASLLGLSSAALGDGVIPAVQKVSMFIGKTDIQVNQANRFSARWSVFNNTTPENVGGGLNTRETATDFQDRMDSVGLQLTSTIGMSTLNEVRVAYGRRNNPRVPSAAAGPGPRVTITGVANFGGSATDTEFRQTYWQFVDNLSWYLGRHNLKVGFDVQFIDDYRLSDVSALYTFPTVDAFLAAKNGTNPFGYTRFQQAVGDPTVSYTQQYYSAFIQDDFRITPNFKLLYGVRYDLFKVPDANPNAPFPGSREFRVDKNNFGPRVGFAWSLDESARTVVRASTGIMYEPPLGMFYQDALQESGESTFLTASVTPSQAGAPAYPGTLSSLPPGVTPSRSIRTVASDFDTQYAILSNVQVERALNNDTSVALGYVNSTGRSLPVLLNSNVIPTGATLPDGRPIYSRAINASTRVDPTFDTINEVRSTGTSAYNAMTISLNRRFSKGFQAQASYTLAKAEDDGVIGGRYVVGSTDAAALSDPSNQARDYSYTSWNTTHTFIASAVIRPEVSGSGIGAALLNDNQLSIIFQANSGLPFNIRSNRDLNLDGISADRPNGIARNTGELGKVINVDARYSRFIPVSGNMKGELFVEAKNLFNNENTRSVNSVVATDTLGNPIAAIPSTFASTNTYQARQVQVGFKFLF